MPKKTRYHLMYRVLVIAAVVAALPLTLGFILIQHSAKTRLSDAAGANFVWLAEQSASSVDAAFAREFEILGAVARSPSVVDALRSSGDGSAPPDPRVLLELSRARALYHELFLVRPDGTLISQPEQDASFASDKGFQKALRRSRGKTEASDGWAEVGSDPGLLTLYRPVREPSSGEFLGLVRADVDTERLFVAISSLRLGDTGHACLYDLGTGRVLAGRTGDCAADGRYARFRDAERAQRQGNRYFLAGVEGPQSFDRADALLVAVARPELARGLPELEWIVAVEQSLAETHAPLAPMSRELILYFLAMGALVVLLAAFVSYQLERPVSELDVDLHHELAKTGGSESRASL